MSKTPNRDEADECLITNSIPPHSMTMSASYLNAPRGLNRQQAIGYLGIKGTQFDKEIRPKLHAIKMGTSIVFDRRELDSMFDKLMMLGGDVGPTEKGLEKWPKEPQASRKQKTVAGESTKPTKELDFRDVLKRIKQRKHGC